MEVCVDLDYFRIITVYHRNAVWEDKEKHRQVIGAMLMRQYKRLKNASSMLKHKVGFILFPDWVFRVSNK